MLEDATSSIASSGVNSAPLMFKYQNFSSIGKLVLHSHQIVVVVTTQNNRKDKGNFHSSTKIACLTMGISELLPKIASDLSSSCEAISTRIWEAES